MEEKSHSRRQMTIVKSGVVRQVSLAQYFAAAQQGSGGCCCARTRTRELSQAQDIPAAQRNKHADVREPPQTCPQRCAVVIGDPGCRSRYGARYQGAIGLLWRVTGIFALRCKTSRSNFSPVSSWQGQTTWFFAVATTATCNQRHASGSHTITYSAPQRRNGSSSYSPASQPATTSYM